MSRITYHTPDGRWGIEGVDLATLPPKIYMALYKLKDYEDIDPSPDVLEDKVSRLDTKGKGTASWASNG